MTSSCGTLVLGIGNVLLRDEGAGVHAVRQLASRLPPREDITLVDGGTLSFFLADAIENASQLIVIDAAQLNAEPGATRIFLGAEMDAFVGGNRRCSVHEVCLIDLMAIALLTDKLPEKRALIGIQPHQIDWGETPSSPVVAAIHQACNQTLQLIETWQTC